jgi:hypothetical protein
MGAIGRQDNFPAGVPKLPRRGLPFFCLDRYNITNSLPCQTGPFMRNTPFPFSLMQQSALSRLLFVALVIVLLWLCIHWAVLLP